MNSKVNPQKEWLTTYEVQTLYSIGKKKLHSMVSQGKLGMAKIEGRNYYRKAEIEEIFTASYVKKA